MPAESTVQLPSDEQGIVEQSKWAEKCKKVFKQKAS